jgi:hypothetical protein
MVRRYDEAVEVREASTSEPALFLWRGRLYVVREVLGHWRERRAWWLEGATARLLGLEESPDSDRVDSDRVTSDHAGSDHAVSDVLEREIWRVEAGPGRDAGVGVYDLGRDLMPAQATEPTRWRLLKIAD